MHGILLEGGALTEPIPCIPTAQLGQFPSSSSPTGTDTSALTSKHCHLLTELGKSRFCFSSRIQHSGGGGRESTA